MAKELVTKVTIVYLQVNKETKKLVEKSTNYNIGICTSFKDIWASIDLRIARLQKKGCGINKVTIEVG